MVNFRELPVNFGERKKSRDLWMLIRNVGLMRHRKKPSFIDAVRWTGANQEEVVKFCVGMFPTAEDLEKPIGEVNIRGFFGDNGTVQLLRKDGVVAIVVAGDYIARGEHGNYEPFAAELFESIWEPDASSVEVSV